MQVVGGTRNCETAVDNVCGVCTCGSRPSVLLVCSDTFPNNDTRECEQCHDECIGCCDQVSVHISVSASQYLLYMCTCIHVPVPLYLDTFIYGSFHASLSHPVCEMHACVQSCVQECESACTSV